MLAPYTGKILGARAGGTPGGPEAIVDLRQHTITRMQDTTAYKILTADQWAALNADTFAGAPVDQADGFVHLSTAAQLSETLDLHFPGETGLVIAAIDLVALGCVVRWEPSRQGQLFPHVYAPLTRAVVVGWCPVERDSKGGVRLPG